MNVEIPNSHEDLSYSIVDLSGKTLKQAAVSSSRTAINTSDLAVGMYNLILKNARTGKIRGVEKFVIR
jgi:hypothetical protein